MESTAQHKSKIHKVKLILHCEKGGSLDDNLVPSFKVENDTIIGEALHFMGCPIFSIDDFYDAYKVPITIIVILIGVLCAFLGRKLFKPVLFIIIFIGVTGMVFIIFSQTLLLQINTNAKQNYIIAIAISAAIGITAGALILVFNRVCFFILGGFGGAVGGFLLYTAVLAPLIDKTVIQIHKT